MSRATILYGIKNCDSIKKARHWLAAKDISYQFYDVREQGISHRQITQWLKHTDWQTLLNKRSTTWKQIEQSTRDSINETSAIKLMAMQPTLIKRPVLEHNHHVYVGFKPDDYHSIFN